jgi:hypothetical protein
MAYHQLSIITYQLSMGAQGCDGDRGIRDDRVKGVFCVIIACMGSALAGAVE